MFFSLSATAENALDCGFPSSFESPSVTVPFPSTGMSDVRPVRLFLRSALSCSSANASRAEYVSALIGSFSVTSELAPPPSVFTSDAGAAVLLCAVFSVSSAVSAFSDGVSALAAEPVRLGVSAFSTGTSFLRAFRLRGFDEFANSAGEAKQNAVHIA